MRLHLPLVLTSVIVGTVAVACTGTGTGGGDDDSHHQNKVFCSGFDIIDGGAGQPDAQMCGQLVDLPQDCPEGCHPLV